MRSLMIFATGAATVALINLAPTAHADPDQYCQPLSRTYSWSTCEDEPQNDPNCTEYGDSSQCMSDWRDLQDQIHQQYPTPN